MANQTEIFSARSCLFAPGDSERKMEKATASAADAVILDLEDAVAEEAKPKARAMVSAFLKAQLALWKQTVQELGIERRHRSSTSPTLRTSASGAKGF